MNRNIWMCPILVLGWAVTASGQQPVIHYLQPVEDPAGIPLQDASGACPGCEIPWVLLPNGRLWADYCMEQELGICRGPACHLAPAILSRAPSFRPLVPTWRSKRKHRGLLNLDLFCDLMGWRASTRSRPGTGGCQHGHGHAAQGHAAQPLPDELGPVPVPEIELDGGLVPLLDVPDAGEISTPEESSPQRRVLPGLEVDPPATRDAVPAPPDPPATPEVPRNTLPTIRPASSTPAGKAKVLVAEKLSDYIQL